MSDKNKSKTPSSGGKNLKIGPWILGVFLGQGYAAQVREACHEKTGQKAAIKILTKDDTNEKADLLKKMREKEITIMKLVDHPNIVKLYDVYETANHIYLVMELLQGSLFSYVVKSVRVSPGKALVLFQQIIEALDYMHKHLICHRDLKPENFLLNSQSTLKVCDFGFASLMKGDDEMLTTRCGTLHYASPDILTEGDGYDGRLHDVWSAGVNLYVMVTGELPFNDKNPKILLRKIMTGTFEFPPQVPLPYDLKDLIFRMLTVDAKQRISIPEIKRHSWYCSKPYNIPVDVAAHINIEEPIEDIDEQILNGILLLGVGWDNIDQLRTQLKQKGANSEKVVYLLLLRKKLSPPSLESFSYSYADKVARGEQTGASSGSGSGALTSSSTTPATTTTTSTTPTNAPSVPPLARSNSSSALPTPTAPPLNLSGANANATSPPISPRNGSATARPSKSSSGGSTRVKKKSYRLSVLPDDHKREDSEETLVSARGSRRGKTPPVNEPEQNQAVSSIDKILNWFNKEKQTKNDKASARKSGAFFGKKKNSPLREDNEEEGFGATNGNGSGGGGGGPGMESSKLANQNEAFSSMNEEEEGTFFDLIMRANQTPKGDLRIRPDGKGRDDTSPPTSTINTTTANANPTTTQTNSTPASSMVPANNHEVPSPGPAETGVDSRENSKRSAPPEIVLPPPSSAEPIDVVNKAPVSPHSDSEKSARSKGSKRVARSTSHGQPLTVYISFVPNEMTQDYEEDHRRKDTFSANRCTLQSRDVNGVATKIDTKQQFETAVSNKLSIEILP
eukprot:TRINITY_DN3853_c0_g1_i1.p1 TRINITY_DN3853_c0_g1~~TRINITY_DN3853_c0_g1_i1.p1  ORF type:complete len:793 (-),score=174.57 TRINITY_DN3853_c0_g1_i1:92-2470(-)